MFDKLPAFCLALREQNFDSAAWWTDAHSTGCLRKEKAFLLFRLVSSDLTPAKSPRPKYNASTIACQFVVVSSFITRPKNIHKVKKPPKEGRG